MIVVDEWDGIARSAMQREAPLQRLHQLGKEHGYNRHERRQAARQLKKRISK